MENFTLRRNFPLSIKTLFYLSLPSSMPFFSISFNTVILFLSSVAAASLLIPRPYSSGKSHRRDSDLIVAYKTEDPGPFIEERISRNMF